VAHPFLINHIRDLGVLGMEPLELTVRLEGLIIELLPEKCVCDPDLGRDGVRAVRVLVLELAKGLKSSAGDFSSLSFESHPKSEQPCSTKTAKATRPSRVRKEPNLSAISTIPLGKPETRSRHETSALPLGTWQGRSCRDSPEAS
jgi:hypothetical protein